MTATERKAALAHVEAAQAALAALSIDLNPRLGGHGTPADMARVATISRELFDARTALGAARGVL